MFPVRDEDEELRTLQGVTLEAGTGAGVVRYRIDRPIGQGGLGMAFLALRDAPDGVAPVVIKLVRPSVMAMGPTALTAVRKELVALSRLNERVPPTPFVVRFIDNGVITFGRPALELPWIAIEYIYGGVEGTTLEERVRYSCAATGYAFEPERAAHAIRCLTAGLQAVHGVGVIHRDLTPNNVLCCSFGEAEIFKISDFGLARSGGMAETFGNVILGTAGYAPPEQSFPDTVGVGPYSDVFSLACVVFLTLTGERYFEVSTVAQALVAARDERRRSLADSPRLCPELRARPDACAALDAALARATAYDPGRRPSTPEALAVSIVPWLSSAPDTVRASRRLLKTLVNQPSSLPSNWVWTVRHPPADEGRVVRSAAWDGDGHCLVATTSGLAYWNGTAWLRPSGADTASVDTSFVLRTGPGAWLLGGRSGALRILTAQTVREVAPSPVPDADLSWIDASGRLDDVLVAAAQPAASAPMLFAFAGGRWVQRIPLPDAASISALVQLDAARWLVAGRLQRGGAFASLYEPRSSSLTPVSVPPTRALIAAASQPDRALAILAGADGTAVRVEGDRVTSSTTSERIDLSATALDIQDREWVASPGRLYVSDPAAGIGWKLVWQDGSWNVPFVSLMADFGHVVAMTADGGILEGRALSGR